MSDRQRDVQVLYQLLCPPAGPDQAHAARPSLLPWIGYALLGLVNLVGLAAALLAALR